MWEEQIYPQSGIVLYKMGRIDPYSHRTDLLNPTSWRDASHSYLISTWPKEWCTIVCVIMGGTNLSPFMSITNRNYPFAQIKDGLMSLPINIPGTSFQKNTFNHFAFRELRIYNVFLYGHNKISQQLLRFFHS